MTSSPRSSAESKSKLPEITVSFVRADSFAQVPETKLDKTAVALDFDLTVKYLTQADGDQKTEFRGGKPALLVMQQWLKNAARCYIATARGSSGPGASASNFDSVIGEMDKVWIREDKQNISLLDSLVPSLKSLQKGAKEPRPDTLVTSKKFGCNLRLAILDEDAELSLQQKKAILESGELVIASPPTIEGGSAFRGSGTIPIVTHNLGNSLDASLKAAGMTNTLCYLLSARILKLK